MLPIRLVPAMPWDSFLRAAAMCAAGAWMILVRDEAGALESLIEHPGRMTHASAAGSPLEVPDDLVRLSVGIETIDDLLEDLAYALA